MPGKKRPASPGSPPSDGDDSSISDGGWTVSDSGSDEEECDEEEYRGAYRPFTVDDFPRLGSGFLEQTGTLYEIPDIHLRGPRPLSLFRAYKDHVIIENGNHVFADTYQLSDESEVSVGSITNVDCSNQCHCFPATLVQFIDLKIAGYRHTQPGHAKIFGFFAARDYIKPLRNYIYRHNVDNCEAVSVKQKTGMARLSLTSPARGCTEFTEFHRSESFVETRRLYGEKCGLDVKFAVLSNAVQAMIDVEILHASIGGLNLKLFAKTSGFSDVIRLFRGVVEAGYKMSSVVAVEVHSYLGICIEGSSTDNDDLDVVKWESRFDASYHGTVAEVVKLDDLVTISVKISWEAVHDRRQC
uniref:DUF6598 domain-containing protein n=1 Tax=Leersia perrieri TaxID=77586 RepID=A0A0D9Y0P5_9ORYZ